MASLGDLYNDLKTLCKQWFYDKTEADSRFSPKKLSDANYFVLTDSSKELTTQQKLGNIDKNGAIGGTANLPLITTSSGVITTGSFGNSANTFCEGNDSRLSDARTPTAHTHYDADIDIYAPTDLTNIASLAGVLTSQLTTQQKVNTYIDLAFAQVSGIKALEVVSTLPTASASTMGMLYIINEDSKINFYYTEDKGAEASPRYVWRKMDTDILDELVVNWSDVQNKPSSFTPASHAHGQITNDGKITSTAVTIATGDNILITDTSDSSKVKRVANLLTDHIKDGTAHSNIGSSANATQSSINSSIDTALSNKISTSSTSGLVKNDGSIDTTAYLSSLPDHNHGNILNGGTITQTVTNNGNLVVTNSSNEVGVQSAIDVLDGVVNQLITYGSS